MMNAFEKKWKDAPLSAVIAEVNAEMQAILAEKPDMPTYDVNMAMEHALNRYIPRETLADMGVSAVFEAVNKWHGVSPSLRLIVKLRKGHPSYIVASHYYPDNTRSWEPLRVKRVTKDGRRTFGDVHLGSDYGFLKGVTLVEAVEKVATIITDGNESLRKAARYVASVASLCPSDFLRAVTYYERLTQKGMVSCHPDKLMDELQVVAGNTARTNAILEAAAEGKRVMPAGMKKEAAR